MDSYETLFENFFNDFKTNKIQNKGTEWLMSIDPVDIFNSPDVNYTEKFWSQHGENAERYKELVLNYQKAKTEINKNGNLEHLKFGNPILNAYETFHGSEPIRLIEYNGKLMVDGNGRHRIEAAKILKAEGHNIQLSALVTRWQLEASHNPEENEKPLLFNLPKNSPGMSHQIENQISLLKEAKDLFFSHAEKIQELTENFNSSVRSLEQDELNHDYMDFLEEFLSDYIIKLKTVREVIEDEYVPLLNRKIQYLEDRE